nr:TPA_asm: adenain [Astyanax tetra cavefish adintovirus]
MDTRELLELMKSCPFVKKIFCGVLPCDELPEGVMMQFPALFIVNTHPSHMPGEHWLAICLNDGTSGEFFDSYGNSPIYELFPDSIYSFLKKNCVEIKHNSKQVQSFDSVCCGQHCIFFLCHRAKGYSFNQIMSLYTNDLKRNDDMVVSFVKKMYPRVNKHCVMKCVQCVNSGEKFRM